jgi:hypothetical protein
VPVREKSPIWEGSGGAELEAAVDAERGGPKPMEVRGTWDIVSAEGGEERGSVRTSDRGDKEVNCSKRITM